MKEKTQNKTIPTRLTSAIGQFPSHSCGGPSPNSGTWESSFARKHVFINNLACYMLNLNNLDSMVVS